jgi:hypothetical protein
MMRFDAPGLDDISKANFLATPPYYTPPSLRLGSFYWQTSPKVTKSSNFVPELSSANPLGTITGTGDNRFPGLPGGFLILRQDGQ